MIFSLLGPTKSVYYYYFTKKKAQIYSQTYGIRPMNFSLTKCYLCMFFRSIFTRGRRPDNKETILEPFARNKIMPHFCFRFPINHK